MITAYNDIDDLIVAFEYNRDDEYLIAILQEVVARLNKNWHKNTDDGDILYSYIILRYGDYGTSPRSGWIENETQRQGIISCLLREIESIKDQIEERERR